MRVDPTTRAYVARRLPDAKTTREIRRCLKRYITRQIHRTLTAILSARRHACADHALNHGPI